MSLDALVPQANFDRHLEAKLDLSFVREWAGNHTQVAGTYTPGP